MKEVFSRVARLEAKVSMYREKRERERRERDFTLLAEQVDAVKRPDHP